MCLRNSAKRSSCSAKPRAVAVAAGRMAGATRKAHQRRQEEESNGSSKHGRQQDRFGTSLAGN